MHIISLGYFSILETYFVKRYDSLVKPKFVTTVEVKHCKNASMVVSCIT